MSKPQTRSDAKTAATQARILGDEAIARQLATDEEQVDNIVTKLDAEEGKQPTVNQVERDAKIAEELNENQALPPLSDDITLEALFERLFPAKTAEKKAKWISELTDGEYENLGELKKDTEWFQLNLPSRIMGELKKVSGQVPQVGKSEGDGKVVASILDVEHLLREVGADMKTVSDQARGWTFAHPWNIGLLHVGASDVYQQAVEGIRQKRDTEKDERAPRIIASMGCAGSGKSELCDVSPTLFFPDKKVTHIKVTYNIVDLTSWDLDTKTAAEAFKWRMIASVSGLLPTVYQVPNFVRAAAAKFTLTDEFLKEFVTKYMEKNDICLLVIDEIRKLQHKDCISNVMSAASDFAGTGFWDAKLSRYCLVTGFGVGDVIMSLSDRPYHWLSQSTLSLQESVQIATQMELMSDKAALAMRCIIFAGGHARSLVELLSELQRSNEFSPSKMSIYMHSLGMTWDDAEKFIASSFTAFSLSAIAKDEFLCKHISSGLIHVDRPSANSDDVWLSIPPAAIQKLLLAPEGQKSTPVQNCMSSMFALNTGQAPAKLLETLCVQSDRMRGLLGLCIVPPSMNLHFPAKPERQSARNLPDHIVLWNNAEIWKTLKLLEPQNQASTEDLISTSWQLLVNGSGFPTSMKMCIPAAVTHPGLESAYIAGAGDFQVMVLHQQKINDDLKSAIQGLNKAAEVLAQIWDKPFLYVVVAMEVNEKKESTIDKLNTANYPTLLVTKNNAKKYWSPSFSGVALSLLYSHRFFNTSEKKATPQKARTNNHGLLQSLANLSVASAPGLEDS